MLLYDEICNIEISSLYQNLGGILNYELSSWMVIKIKL